MAQQVIQLDGAKLSCSICLDPLRDPVIIPCGHSYCKSCINDYWDEEDKKKTHSCPQCRQSFTPRPALVKNTMLAELVEDLKKIGLQAASPDHFYAGPGDVACDFCTGRKLKASKSCLMCMASYCEQHLQPHYDVAPLKKHKLVEAILKLEANICSRHDEVMKIFCRTDQKAICHLCTMDDHKGHDTVCAAAEWAERQKELKVSHRNIQQRVQDREKEVKVLQQRVEAINLSADEAVRGSEKIFTELIRLVERRRCEVKQQIRSQQKTEVRRAKELEEKLQQEINELRKKDTELDQLSHTDDHLHFLDKYYSLSRLSKSKDLLSVDVDLQCSFQGVIAAVSEARDKLQAVLSEDWTKISLSVTPVGAVLSPAEPRTRAEFIRYFCQITLDPETVSNYVLLSDRNRKASHMGQRYLYLHNPDRFLDFWQVLSRDGLTSRYYWEVEWNGAVCIAVAYKTISREGSVDECGFGYNDKSWALDCSSAGYKFRHNNVITSVSGPQSSRIGVYLDHSAGTLSYYSVSGTMTLLHTVQTKFTQPLYLGLWLLNGIRSTAELCELK